MTYPCSSTRARVAGGRLLGVAFGSAKYESSADSSSSLNYGNLVTINQMEKENVQLLRGRPLRRGVRAHPHPEEPTALAAEAFRPPMASQ